MRVIITESISNEYGIKETSAYSVKTPKHLMGLYNMYECPEDATLNRDLGCIFCLPNIIKEAYEAGKNGEELVFENVVEED